MKGIMFFVMSFFALGLAHAAGTAGVGNGGDPLYFEFEDARHYAATRIANAVACAFSATVPSNVRQWILQNQAALADDILGTNYTWTTATEPTCGFTQGTPKADVLFSSTVCRPEIKDVSDAIWMVVHESVLHFGFADDNFPTAAAGAIADIGLNSTCTEQPSSDPFDPASCPGTPISSATLLTKVGLPNTNQTRLGSFNVSIRTKTCYSPVYCTAWSPARDDDEYAFSINGTTAPTTGDVIAELRNNAPDVLLASTILPVQGYSPGYSWNLFSKVDQNLNLGAVSGLQDQQFGIYFTGAYFAPVQRNPTPISLNGWMTDSCLRQTATGSRSANDNLGNAITVDYEAVILSHFN